MATLTYVYADSTVVVGPLSAEGEPHSWDLCAAHALRITAPRGWDLVRHPDIDDDEDSDLTALLDAVTGGPVGAVASASTVISPERLRRLGVADPGAGDGNDVALFPQTAPRRPHLRIVPDMDPAADAD